MDTAQPPDGLLYRPELITGADEDALLATFDELEFHEIRMRGQAARRTARHFGYSYEYEAGSVAPGEPVPDWLEPLRARCGDLAGVAPEALVEALVQRYPPGAGIGWHRDAPPFGTVVGVSLRAPARMRFRRTKGGTTEVFELRVDPRSAYVLSGSARWAWQHSISPTDALRYSVTFRTLREPRA